MSERWYRYEDCHAEFGSSIRLREYRVVKHTPRGVKLHVYGATYRQVLNTSRKKFAHPTIEAAKESYIARKECHVKILSQQVSAAERCLWLAKDGQWHGEFMSSIDFDVKKLEKRIGDDND